jgi:hypothetical protein
MTRDAEATDTLAKRATVAIVGTSVAGSAVGCGSCTPPIPLKAFL